MAIAVFMILNQLGIATAIVNATYIALIGAVGLGSALAFGLGGRDAAADLINSVYRKAQQQSDQVQRDLEQGRERAHAEAQQYTEQYTQQCSPTGRPGDGPGAGTTGAFPAGAEQPTTRVTQPGDPYGRPGTPPARQQPALVTPRAPYLRVRQ